MIYYTGVGSRQTPDEVLHIMRDFGEAAAKRGWTLRSGAADGADLAFEEGARRVRNAGMEIYLPWPKFNGHSSPLHLSHGDMHGEAARLARSVHPRWSNLGPQVQKLHVRNVHQVLGPNVESPEYWVKSAFLLCWTPDGAECKAERTAETGGTGTAIELASNLGVTVFNLARKGRLGNIDTLLAIT